MVTTDPQNIEGTGGEPGSSLPALRVSPSRLLDGLWLLALIIYALAGFSLAPFHGDENIIIYESHDFATVFIQGQPQSLAVSPPYQYDTLEISRVLDATLPRYLIGLSWYLSGLSEADLPAHMWFWALDYDANLQRGNVPSDRLLTAARIPSAIFLGLSIAVMFALGRRFGGRSVAYLASGLYAVNPLILLNGRRAMQEGSLLFFGLLTLLIAAIISRQQAGDRRSPWGWWLGLTLTGLLTLGSKNSGVLYLAAAYGWIFCVALFHQRWRSLLQTCARLAASGVITLALLIALSPGLWSHPLARLGDMVTERRKAMQMQVDVNIDAPTTLSQRVTGIITQPFLTPAHYYEVFFWADFDAITRQIARYETSHLDGLHFGVLLGISLTLLAAAGIGATLWPGLRPYPSVENSVGLMVWLAVMIAAALANPLPWQRYYLQLIPLASLLAAIGLVSLVRGARGHIPLRQGLTSEPSRAR